MPFDGKITLTRLEKLERLLKVAMQSSGDQSSFCTCLLHDCWQDETLLAAGLPVPRVDCAWQTGEVGIGMALSHAVAAFFGIAYPSSTSAGGAGQWNRVFGAQNINEKRAYIRQLIQEEMCQK